MSFISNLLSILLLAVLLTACSVVQPSKGAADVKIAADPLQLGQCQYLGEVTGSEGHWYTYIFLANRTMVQAAVDDLRNRAAALGGDTIFICENTPFITSVTLLGLVYRCSAASNN